MNVEYVRHLERRVVAQDEMLARAEAQLAAASSGNAFERTAREWAKGCSCVKRWHPSDCPTCTQAFLDAVLREVRKD